MQKIGLLWDSASNNMGDQAIGSLLQRAFAAQHIPHAAIDLFDPDLRDTVMLVIGGGELIRPEGNAFYDTFRVPGRHILNTVGVLDGSADLDYLRDYRLVTVRSAADQKRLGFGEIAPCLSLLYADYLQEPLSFDIPRGAVGIHVHAGSLRHAWELVRWLNLHLPYPIVWLPVTHYNADIELMRVLASRVPNSFMLPVQSPDQIFQIIGKLRFLVSSSLHATLFAYAQNIPFLAWNGSPKIATFLEERNLSRAGFDDSAALTEKLSVLLDHFPDFSHSRLLDQQRCRTVLEQIFTLSETAFQEQTPSAAIPFKSADRYIHTTEVNTYRAVGENTAVIHRLYFDLLDPGRDHFKGWRYKLRRRLYKLKARKS